MKPQTETLFSSRVLALRENRERLYGVQDKLYSWANDSVAVADFVREKTRKYILATKLEKVK